jgi:hypothetical protein
MIQDPIAVSAHSGGKRMSYLSSQSLGKTHYEAAAAAVAVAASAGLAGVQKGQEKR